ncbi:MAG TPA: undecaprenyldiphospho-muramoylpentapeptide beta-N-acetylglucosaminyltransferase [Bacteroidota bacterium]|nr:undecaprenyldiphospho-muramoylpentapeptide beta-N-acetylglucosaminyltransferase [Bacteroidota bacterium]
MSVTGGHACVLFAGGGTGGHLFPALAIAEEIRSIDPRARCVFVGTKNKIESRVVPQKGYEFFTIWISGFHRRLTADNLAFPVKVVVSLIQAYRILKSVRPNAVVGTGGYVCGPVLYMASVLGIPVVIHESNSYPGVTTRLLARRATEVMITFAETARWLPAGVTPTVMGNPTRRELDTTGHEEASASFRLDPEKKTVLVFGGSLGAASINLALERCIAQWTNKQIQVIWQTGAYEGSDRFRAYESESVRVVEFIDAMSRAYAASDLVVCRSGATTLAELTRLGKPAILIPYPQAAANHQELNARALVESGAARMIPDSKANDLLCEAVIALLDDDATRTMMSAKSRALGRPEAGRAIAHRILELAR